MNKEQKELHQSAEIYYLDFLMRNSEINNQNRSITIIVFSYLRKIDKNIFIILYLCKF